MIYNMIVNTNDNMIQSSLNELGSSGLSRLTNAKQGDFYGPAASWGVKKKRLLGIFLLMKAMKIYLIEGERQIKQRDLTK